MLILVWIGQSEGLSTGLRSRCPEGSFGLLSWSKAVGYSDRVGPFSKYELSI